MADETKQAEDAEQRSLTEEELRVAYDGPAVAANRCLIALGPSGVRITFAEQHGDIILNFRTAVVLSVQEAISLKDTLTRLLAPIEAQIGDAEAQIKKNG